MLPAALATSGTGTVFSPDFLSAVNALVLECLHETASLKIAAMAGNGTVLDRATVEYRCSEPLAAS